MIERTGKLAIVQGSPEWHAWRAGGIGGSDVAAVLGLDDYRSPLDVQRDKLGYSQPLAETGRMTAGKILEPHVAKLYADATGREVHRLVPQIHVEHAWMRGSADRGFSDDAGHGLLEIKTTSPMNFRKIKLHGIPSSWLLQLQWYLEIYNVDRGAFAILDRDSFDLLHFDFDRDRELMAEIIPRVGDWWEAHIVNRLPVEIAPPAQIALPNVGGEVVNMDDSAWQDAIDALRTASDIAAEAVALKSDAEARVKALMLGHCAEVAEGAGVRVYYREQAGRKSTDYKRLLADHPGIDLAKYETRGEPFRTLRVYPLGGA